MYPVFQRGDTFRSIVFVYRSMLFVLASSRFITFSSVIIPLFYFTDNPSGQLSWYSNRLGNQGIDNFPIILNDYSSNLLHSLGSNTAPYFVIIDQNMQIKHLVLGYQIGDDIYIEMYIQELIDQMTND